MIAHCRPPITTVNPIRNKNTVSVMTSQRPRREECVTAGEGGGREKKRTHSQPRSSKPNPPDLPPPLTPLPPPPSFAKPQPARGRQRYYAPLRSS